jgi:hypothetical protein
MTPEQEQAVADFAMWANAERREPMASLSADDSGSIDIAVFGSKAKFQGPMALRIAVGLIVIVGIAFAGYTARAIAEKPASQQGAKP